MVVNVTKIYPKMKNKSLLSIEKKKILQNEKKRFIIIIKKHFNLKNIASL